MITTLELHDDDDDEIAYFYVRGKTRELVLSTHQKHEITPIKTVERSDVFYGFILYKSVFCI